MAINRLKLNEDMTQVTWLEIRQHLDKIKMRLVTLTNATVQFAKVANDLGVLLNGQLTMADHEAALSRSCFFQLRQLRSVNQSSPPEEPMTFLHAYVTS